MTIEELKQFIEAHDKKIKEFQKFCFERLDWSNPASCSMASILVQQDMQKKFWILLERKVRELIK